MSCHSDTVVTVFQVMVQGLWGGAADTVWVGQAVDAVGYIPAVGPAKQVISKLEYASIVSMVVL